MLPSFKNEHELIAYAQGLVKSTDTPPVRYVDRDMIQYYGNRISGVTVALSYLPHMVALITCTMYLPIFGLLLLDACFLFITKVLVWNDTCHNYTKGTTKEMYVPSVVATAVSSIAVLGVLAPNEELYAHSYLFVSSLFLISLSLRAGIPFLFVFFGKALMLRFSPRVHIEEQTEAPLTVPSALRIIAEDTEIQRKQYVKKLQKVIDRLDLHKRQLNTHIEGIRWSLDSSDYSEEERLKADSLISVAEEDISRTDKSIASLKERVDQINAVYAKVLRKIAPKSLVYIAAEMDRMLESGSKEREKAEQILLESIECVGKDIHTIEQAIGPTMALTELLDISGAKLNDEIQALEPIVI